MKGIISSTPPSLFFLADNFQNSRTQFPQLTFANKQLLLLKSNPLITCLSSSSSSVVDQEDQDSSDALPFSGCKGCGREQIESGCNSEGRIQGGIATIPGFGWWPIKAYRPCPAFLASGGNYRRRGQSMDDVAFGGGRRAASTDDFDDKETKETWTKSKNRNESKS